MNIEIHPVLIDIVWWISTAIVVLLVIQALYNVVQLLFALQSIFSRRREPRAQMLWQRYHKLCPPITLIVPAYNESKNIVESVSALLALQYPSFEIIVVNDGSKDNTLALLIDAFKLSETKQGIETAIPHNPIRGIYSRDNSRLKVVDKVNGGKADAQNAGINASRSPLVCIVDADSILESDALLRTAQPFIENPMETIAVGGTIRIANESTFKRGRVTEVRLPNRALPMFQVIEYMRSFLIARVAWSNVNSLMLISGAFSMFRQAEVVEVGGFTRGSLGEDLDMIVKLHRHMRQKKEPYRIEFLSDPVCWTEAPETWCVLGRQRVRWQKGALEVFWRYRDMLFNPRYGRIGLIGLPQILFFDVLGPLAEGLGYFVLPIFWAVGVLSVESLLAFFGLIFTFGIFTSVISVLLAELETHRYPKARDLVRLTSYSVLENFGYRQMNAYWRILACVQYLKGDSVWGEMPRTGFAQNVK